MMIWGSSACSGQVGLLAKSWTQGARMSNISQMSCASAPPMHYSYHLLQRRHQNSMSRHLIMFFQWNHGSCIYSAKQHENMFFDSNSRKRIASSFHEKVVFELLGKLCERCNLVNKIYKYGKRGGAAVIDHLHSSTVPEETGIEKLLKESII